MKKIYSLAMLLVGVLFVSSDALAQYCSPRVSGSWDGITRVTTTGGAVNISRFSANQARVNNYTASDSISTNYGQSFNLTVVHYLSAAVFVDWNDDGDFFDAGETITAPTAYQGGTNTTNVRITVPTTAAYGQLRMRVMNGYYLQMRPCGYSSYTGEVEDYRIWIPKPLANDAGATEILPAAACAGNNDVKVRITNFGTSTLDTVTLKGSIRQTGQTPTNYNVKLTNVGLSRLQDTVYTVGTYNFQSGRTYALEFETSLPNGTADSGKANDKISKSGFGPAMGGTYTIGSSTGKDFRTIRLAEAAMFQRGICSPVVFNIQQGTYTEQVKFRKYTGVSATNNVRFRPDPANTGRVRWTFRSTSSTDGSRGTAVFDGAEHIAVDSITVANTGTGTGVVAELVGGSEYISFTGDSLIGYTGTSTSSNFNIVRSYIKNCHNNTFKYNTMIGGAYGLYLRGAGTGASGLQNWTFEHNEILDFNYMGAYVYNCTGTNFNWNVVKNKRNGNYYGLYFYYNYNAHTDFNEVNMNVSSYAYGMYMQYNRSTSGNRGSISNNMISVEGGNGTHYGLRAYYCDYNDIDFNSISIERGNAYPVYLYYGNGVNFRNNVSASWGANYRYYQLGSQTRSHNVWWAPNATATRGTLGSNLLNVDPGFKSFSDLHSSSTALHNTGVSTGITMDIDGDVRCPGTGCTGGAAAPDRGADEYWLPDFDISPVTAGGATCSGVQNVQVKVANVGTRALTSFTVNWSLGGTAQTALVVSGSNVAAGSDTLVTLGTNNFVNGVTYNFEYVTSSPSGNTDQQTFNDTLRESLSSSMGGTYTIGGSTGKDYATITAAEAALAQYGVCAPIVFNMEQGTYTEQVKFGKYVGVSATNNVRFRPDPANTGRVRWTFSSTSATDGRRGTAVFDGAEHIAVDSITVVNTGSGSGVVAELVGGSEYISFTGDSLIGYTGTSTSSNFNIVRSYRHNCHNNTFKYNTMIGGGYGIYLYGAGSGASGLQNWTFEHNEILDFNFAGVYGWYLTGTNFNWNVVKNKRNGNYYGLYFYYNYNAHTDFNEVNMNVSSYAYGMYMMYNRSTSGNRGSISNNMISVQGGNGSHYGLRAYYCDYNDIDFNSISIERGNAYPVYLYYGNRVNFRNNVVASWGANYRYYQLGSQTRSHNVWWAPNATATRGTLGSNLLNVDPGFKSFSDLHTRSAALYNSAMVTTTQSTDIDGDVRCPGTGCPGGSTAPDRGADEYWLPDYDITPVTAGLIPCVGAQDIKMRVSNIGTRALTSFTVNWKIGGVAQTPLVVRSCNVPAGNDTLVTLGSHTFNAGISYNFEYVTSMPSGNTDQQTFNDTLSESMQNAMSGTFSVGTATADYPTYAAAITDLQANGICGPVYLQIQDTTVTENFTVEDIPGVSSVNTVTFEQDPSNTNPGELDGNITLGDISYIIVKDMIINTSGQAFSIKQGKKQNNIKIDNNTFNLTGTSSYAWYDGYYEKNVDSLWFVNNTVNGGYYALRFYGGSSNQKGSMESNIYIENNKMDSYLYMGIYAFYITNLHINNNSIKNDAKSNYTFSYGIYTYYNINVEITKNMIKAGGNSGGYGIYAYSHNRYGAGTDVSTINNNFVTVGNDRSTSTRYGIYLGYYDYRVNLHHNNVCILGQSSGTQYVLYSRYTRNSSIRNNIFENKAGSNTWYRLSNSSVTGDYNGYWTGVAGVNGVTGGTAGTNSIVTNPRFKNPAIGDLRVNSLQLDSAAANVGINEDIFSAPRVLGFHDIGAHEFDAMLLRCMQ